MACLSCSKQGGTRITVNAAVFFLSAARGPNGEEGFRMRTGISLAIAQFRDANPF